MSRSPMIEKLEMAQLKKDIPDFKVGDTISVHFRVIEGNKERVQVFTGTVIARKGTGLSETFSVHRVAYGEGMERVFLLHSPRIAKIEITKRGKVRRSKLYYLRGTSGKRAKVKGRIEIAKKKKVAPKIVEEEPVVEEPVEPVVEKTKPAEPEATESASSTPEPTET